MNKLVIFYKVILRPTKLLNRLSHNPFNIQLLNLTFVSPLQCGTLAICAARMGGTSEIELRT